MWMAPALQGLFDGYAIKWNKPEKFSVGISDIHVLSTDIRRGDDGPATVERINLGIASPAWERKHEERSNGDTA